MVSVKSAVPSRVGDTRYLAIKMTVVITVIIIIFPPEDLVTLLLNKL